MPVSVCFQVSDRDAKLYEFNGYRRNEHVYWKKS